MPLYLGSDLISGVYVGLSASDASTTSVTITANGSYTPPGGVFYSAVTVNVPNANNQNLTITPSESTTVVTASSGYTGLGTVTINAISSTYVGSQVTRKAATTYTPTTTNQTIATNTYLTGVQTIKGDSNLIAGNIKSGVSIFGISGSYTGTIINNQNITINPSDTTTAVVAANGYTGLGTVTVNAIPSDYIGSGILENDSTNLDINGPVVTVPAGYYATTASANVATANHAKPTLTLTTSTGAIRASHIATTGYVISSTTTADLALTTKAATTYTPGTTNQTIAAYQYLTGVQTIKGDSNLVAGNIKSGVSIFGVAGSYSGTTINNQNVTITPSETATAVTAGSGYTGLGTVTINAISTTYVGSQVPVRTSSNLTINGPTVYAPPGYYAATANTSLTASTVTNSVITGQAYLEATNDYGWRTTVNIPAGYYNAISLTATYSSFFPAPSTPATDNKILLGYEAYDKDGKKVTGSMANNSYSAILNQSTTSVTIPAGYHDGTGTVSHSTVTVPNPTISVSSTNGVITASGTWTRGFTTNASYTATAIPYTTLGATTYNATSNNITIAAGRYLTGAQTIRGVTTSGIAAGDIRSGVVIQVGDSASAGRIANVTGTLVVNKYYTGSSAPSSSLGNNGDIYLQT